MLTTAGDPAAPSGSMPLFLPSWVDRLQSGLGPNRAPGLELLSLAWLLHFGAMTAIKWSDGSYVGHIYRHCTRVNLFRLDPLHSFSRLTARTAVGVAAIPYCYMLFSADLYLMRPRMFAYTITFTALAGLTFVWPLMGIHGVLQKEKSCLLKEASLQLQAAFGRLHERASAGDLSEMDGLNKLISSLTLQQAAIERISTWPWRPETPRLLATALLLPLLVFLARRFLSLFLGL